MTDYYLDADGIVRLVPQEVAARAGWVLATDEQVGQQQRGRVRRTTTVTPAKRHRCPKCPDPRQVSPVRWLGIEWIGVPWPKRLRLRWPVYAVGAPGCGCIARLKGWATRRRRSLQP